MGANLIRPIHFAVSRLEPDFPMTPCLVNSIREPRLVDICMYSDVPLHLGCCFHHLKISLSMRDPASRSSLGRSVIYRRTFSSQGNKHDSVKRSKVLDVHSDLFVSECNTRLSL